MTTNVHLGDPRPLLCRGIRRKDGGGGDRTQPERGPGSGTRTRDAHSRGHRAPRPAPQTRCSVTSAQIRAQLPAFLTTIPLQVLCSPPVRGPGGWGPAGHTEQPPGAGRQAVRGPQALWLQEEPGLQAGEREQGPRLSPSTQRTPCPDSAPRRKMGTARTLPGHRADASEPAA